MRVQKLATNQSDLYRKTVRFGGSGHLFISINYSSDKSDFFLAKQLPSIEDATFCDH